jgi:hypothetical protein
MLARRVLVLAAVLLALGAVAASLAPRDTTTPRPPTPSAAAPRLSQGRDVTLAVDASARRVQTVSARVGDHVRLTVRASGPDAVSIAALGESQAVDPYSPATFDFLPRIAGSFPVTLQQSGRRVATLRIRPAA